MLDITAITLHYCVMAHIHTEPGQHDLTASAFIFRTDTPEPMVLMHLHKKLHKWLQIGGHVELNETPWQAVIHEIAEESGYHIDQLILLQPSTARPILKDAVAHPFPLLINTHRFDSKHFHTDISFIFTTTEEPRLPVAEDEKTEMKFMTLAELEHIPVGEIPENCREICRYAFTEVLPLWLPVPTNTFES